MSPEQAELNAGHRHAQIRGDLDRIVMKAIDKDRANRYESADAMAQDIQRFLRHEPVVAAPPTTLYRLRKFVRRNRTSVTAGALISLALVVGLGLAVIGWIHAQNEALRAQQQAAAAEAVLEFLNDGLLAQADPFIGNPERAGPRDLKLLSAIRSAAAGIEDRFQDQPRIEAALRLTVGRAYRRLAEIDPAQIHLERAVRLYEQELGPDHSNTLEARLELAWLRIQQARLPEAEKLSQQILESQRRILGPDHEKTLEAMTCLGHAYRRGSRDREAQTLFREVLQRAEGLPGMNPLTVLSAMDGLAWTHYELGDVQEKVAAARATYEQAQDTMGPDHPITLNAMVTVVNDLFLRPKAFHEADALAQEGHARCLRVLGEEHPTTIALLSEMAGLGAARGLNFIPLQRKVVALSERALGRDDPVAIHERMKLGLNLASLGYREEGTGLLEQAVETLHRTEGPDTLLGIRAMRWLARAYVAQGRYTEAEQLRTRPAEALPASDGHEQRLDPYAALQSGESPCPPGQVDPRVGIVPSPPAPSAE
jgi:eukaryotic-like serine/threonine-protein kinase